MKNRKKIPEIYFLQAEFCKTIAQPKRLMILESLSKEAKTISQLSLELYFSQPNVSQHVKTLYEKGILEKLRKGNEVYYKLKYPEILEASKIVRDVMMKIYSEKGKILGVKEF
ncbi:MAG: metalloregulator ArsR/SmtB family transcription factor [Candidatus Hydrothermales bacterium]